VPFIGAFSEIPSPLPDIFPSVWSIDRPTADTNACGHKRSAGRFARQIRDTVLDRICSILVTLLNSLAMASMIKEVFETFVTLKKGFSVTFRNMLRKTVTENYPEEPVHFQPRYRGIHVLHRDESGLEKCVGCFLCAAACPARCIYIEAAENTDSQRISAGERYARVYNIDYSRCIFCGYCVEACPTDAITHGHGFELATSNINAMIYRKEKLLEKTPSTS
jgi:NADH-quinone oxidoreductase subunit I